MRLTVNGEEKEFDETILNMKDFILSFNIKTRYFAVMLNGEIISKKLFEQTNLNDGDTVEIVHMVGGG